MHTADGIVPVQGQFARSPKTVPVLHSGMPIQLLYRAIQATRTVSLQKLYRHVYWVKNKQHMGLYLPNVASPLYPFPSAFLLGDFVNTNPEAWKQAD